MGKKLKAEATGKDPGLPSGGAIPVLGAMGGGDGSWKLGRPRKPWKLTGGSPSMSADSGYASIDQSARVNRGYEEDEDRVYYMFDEPEDEEDDDDLEYHLITRKLPRYASRHAPKMSLRESDSTISDIITSAGLSVPLVDTLIGTGILKNDAKNCAISFASFVEKSGISDEHFYYALTSNDTALSSIIQKFQNEKDEAIRDASLRSFEEYVKNIKRFFITIAQTYDSALILIAGNLGPQAGTPEEVVTLPFTNMLTGVAGFFARSIPFERLLLLVSPDLSIKTSEMFKVSKEFEKIPKYQEFMRSVIGEGGFAVMPFITSPTRSMRALGMIYRSLRSRIEKSDEDSNLPDEYTDIPIGFIPESEPCPCPIQESRIIRLQEDIKMSIENKIREIVKLSLLEEKRKKAKKKTKKKAAKKDEQFSDELPSAGYGTGYLPYDGWAWDKKEPEIPFISDKESEKALIGSYTTVYSTDVGDVAYHGRDPGPLPSLSEGEALLKNLIHEMMLEDKYQKDSLSKTHPGGSGEERDPELDFVSEEDEEIDELNDILFLGEEDEEEDPVGEASTVASGGGGPMLPMGDMPPSFGRKRRKPWKAAASGFGGASLAENYRRNKAKKK